MKQLMRRKRALIMEKIYLSGRSIEKQRFINATPQRVFKALTEKEELEHWFVQKAEIDMRPEGRIRHEFAPDMVETGKILVIESPQRFSHTWEAFSPSPTTIIIGLSAENAGTRLHFIHTGISFSDAWGNYYNGMSHGWDIHLDHLTSWLETGICPPPGPTRSL
jgi:uncharacterized protein YndB with AHSA1/START domain